MTTWLEWHNSLAKPSWTRAPATSGLIWQILYPIICPVEATLDVIGGKWKVVILFHLSHDGKHRFAELRRKIPGVKERMLTQQLRELEDDGIVHRAVYPEVQPKVEHSLTEYDRTLRPITTVMCE